MGFALRLLLTTVIAYAQYMVRVLQIVLENAMEGIHRAVDFASHRQPAVDIAKKLEVIRLAARHCYPTAEIGDTLAQIEAGYSGRVKT